MGRITILAVFLSAFAIYFLGISIPVLDIDSAQYASMSREMLERGDFLHVYDEGRDYLDKPPFLFWISSLSMWIFGPGNFAFRFPAILFTIIAVYAVFRFAKLYYNETIARLSALVLAVSQALFLITHDVRTDTILTSWVIISIWQLAEWYQHQRAINMILGFSAIAGGMLTKGPIALIVPGLAFAMHFMLRREFLKQVFRWQNIAGICIIAILLFPMAVGLYQQFDMYPEKLVNRKVGVSGIRFFFWTQSFGRITGESEWKNDTSFLFLLQNMLWSFFPWVVFFLFGIILSIKTLIQKKFRLSQTEEGITTGGFVTTYIMLGLSNYQLPHYIFVAFPFAAVITASFLYRLLWEREYKLSRKFLDIFHKILFALAWTIPAMLSWWAFPQTPFFYKLISVLLPLVYLLLLLAKNIKQRLLILCFYTSIGLNLILTGGFYPVLLTYQGGSQAGKWAYEHKLTKGKFKTFRYGHFRSLHFYARQIVQHIADPDSIYSKDIILTDSMGLVELKQAGKNYSLRMEGDNFHVAMLNMKFINPATRDFAVKKYYIVEIR